MILGTCGRTFFDRIHRGVGHRPGYKHSMDRESEVILQATSIAFLDNEDTISSSAKGFMIFYAASAGRYDRSRLVP
jgi:hypothetical protein